MTSTTIEERVARGAALLDDERPDWWQDMDIAALDLSNGDKCVLGQMYGSFEDGEVLLGLTHEGSTAHGFLHTQACNCGLLHPGSFEDQRAADREFATLTEVWRDLIQQRRLAGHESFADLVERYRMLQVS